ncbi:hypothetical protein ACPZ19_28815 [Amycolatopsis lurida]
MRRDLVTGAAAGLAAWAGMAGWALLGVTLLGLGGATTPAALALAVSGSADLGPGTISLLPLGVSLIGAVLLAVALTTWERVASAAAVFVAGLVVLAVLPDVRLVPTLLGGLTWLAVVLGVRVACWRWSWVRNVAVVLLSTAGVAMLAGAVLSFAGGTRMLGTMLLAAPNLLCVALTRGLGVPWELSGPPLPMAIVETGGFGPLDQPLWPLAVLAVVVTVLVAVFARWHAPWVMALCWAAMAWFGGARVELHRLFRIELGITGDVLVAAGTGLAAGLVACLLVEGARHWHRQRT